jgi:hypothetical protein
MEGLSDLKRWLVSRPLFPRPSVTIRPEISSVAGLRSGIAAFIWMGTHFPTEGLLLVTLGSHFAGDLGARMTV